MEETKEPDLFGICYTYTNDKQEYLYIRANPKGLRRFANDLLDAADKLKNSNRVPLTTKDTKYDWHITDQYLRYVEKIESIKEYYNTNEEVSGNNIPEYLIKLGCWLVVILFLLPFFAGLQTVYNWFF